MTNFIYLFTNLQRSSNQDIETLSSSPLNAYALDFLPEIRIAIFFFFPIFSTVTPRRAITPVGLLS